MQDYFRKRNQQLALSGAAFLLLRQMLARNLPGHPEMLRCTEASEPAGWWWLEKGEDPHDGGNQAVQHKEKNIAERNRSARLGEMLIRWQTRQVSERSVRIFRIPMGRCEAPSEKNLSNAGEVDPDVCTGHGTDGIPNF